MLSDLNKTPEQMEGLNAACDSYNAANPGTEEAPATPLTPDEYWTFVFDNYRGTETEQEVFDRATASYYERLVIGAQPK